MSSTRFVMVGGFLGAGKTSTIARLARVYEQQGLKVGIVTNDQAANLVDTLSLRSQGFDVGEVAGSCFCCRFEELTSVLAELSEKHQPDLLLAEPVGSCTDLIATVIQPLLQLHADRFEVAPYGVILKPSHGRRILGGESKAGFSPKAEYIFKKQLEEADFILLNRIDELSRDEIDELTTLLKQEQPDVPILRVSAQTGEGFQSLLEMLDRKGEFGRKILDLDYDIYAAGEAELGWLNMSLRVNSEKEFPLDNLLLEILGQLQASLAKSNAETAHLKAIGLWEGFYGVANLVSRESSAELSLPSHCRATSADFVINARVALAPELLQEQVERAVLASCDSLNATVEFRQTQSFRPGRPEPTHRFDRADD